MYGHRQRTFPPKHITIIRLGLLVTAKVDVATPAIIPGPTHELRIVFALTQVQGMSQSGFTQIVDSRPDKIAYHIRMLFYKIPVLGGFFRIRLAAINDAVGIGCMITFIFPPDVVVACHIQVPEDSIGVFIPGELAAVPEIV